jgi:hypothetical protein
MTYDTCQFEGNSKLEIPNDSTLLTRLSPTALQSVDLQLLLMCLGSRYTWVELHDVPCKEEMASSIVHN